MVSSLCRPEKSFNTALAWRPGGPRASKILQFLKQRVLRNSVFMICPYIHRAFTQVKATKACAAASRLTNSELAIQRSDTWGLETHSSKSPYQPEKAADMKSKASSIQTNHKCLSSPVAGNLEKGGIHQQQKKV